ncbi:MAG: SRPBCC family protein [Nitrososphaera sp.]
MKEVRTEIEIGAGPEKVWKILADFEKYDQWNPFINRITGQARQGAKIEIHIETPGGKSRKYEPTVTKVDQGRELRWLGKSWLLNGEHIFTIEPLQAERVRFVHREVFEGLLTLLFGKSLDTDVRQGFEEMNKALKERAERAAF